MPLAGGTEMHGRAGNVKEFQKHISGFLQPRVRPLYQSQNVTMAAMQIAEKKVWAHRS